MKILGVIPARFASTRFPGKPLVDIGGKSMIRRVYEQVALAGSLAEMIVATDDQRIYDHVTGFGGRVMMTSDRHRTGTERCNEIREALEKQGHRFDVTINIQGDEPFIDPGQIDLVAGCFHSSECQIATLMKELQSVEELQSPNIIKVISDGQNRAIYFSRSPIPYVRGAEEEEWMGKHKFFKHIGIYAFRSHILAEVCKLQPTPLEVAESLEQLRWLENGYRIHVEVTDRESHSIDTPEDLKKL